MSTLKKNQIYTVSIDGYGSQAQGVCHIDGRAVFVPRALPGESWEIKILKVTNTAVYARGEKLLQRNERERQEQSEGIRKQVESVSSTVGELAGRFAELEKAFEKYEREGGYKVKGQLKLSTDYELLEKLLEKAKQ